MSDAPGSSSGRFKSPTLPCISTTKRPRKMKYRPCQGSAKAASEEEVEGHVEGFVCAL